MRLRLLIILPATFLALIGAGVANASPALQLPWPTGQQHRINGGNQSYNCGSTHQGSNAYAIDFEFQIGQDVAAVAAGTVSVTDPTDDDNRGKWIEIDHGAGFKSRYLHLRTNTPWPPGIAPGVQVSQGQLVAYSGNTGGVQAHLHFDFKLNGGAFVPEPMSGLTGFGQYGLCGTIPNSPYWTSSPPMPWNMLANPSFESSPLSPWQFSSAGSWRFSGGAYDGSWYLRVAPLVDWGSVYQDILNVYPAHGPGYDGPDYADSYVFSAYVRSPFGVCVDGTIVLFGWGIANDSDTTSFRVCGTSWTLIQAPLDADLANYHLRAQIYVAQANKFLDIDATETVQVAHENASFERSEGFDWGIWYRTGTTNWWRNYDPANTKSGAWYLRAKKVSGVSSVYQDIPVVSSPGQAYRFSLWVRSPYSAQEQVTVQLWTIGGYLEGAATQPTISTSAWTLVEVTLPISYSGHTGIRAQIYFETTGTYAYYDMDGTKVYRLY